MRIGDQGFTERVGTSAPSGGTEGVRSSAQGTGSNTSSGASDTLQLSSLAAQLHSASSGDASRSARLTAIAAAVESGSFRVDAARVSSAMVSEAISK